MKTLIFAFLIFHFHFAYGLFNIELINKFKTFFKSKDHTNINCSKITAYYDGTFQSIDGSYQIKNVQLQLWIDVNVESKQLYLNVKDFTKNNGSLLICDTCLDETFPIALDNVSQSHFYANILTDIPGYKPELIYLEPIPENGFTLLNAIGNCATTLKDNSPRGTIRLLYKNCFCCGDKYDPDPSLDCPVSP